MKHILESTICGSDAKLVLPKAGKADYGPVGSQSNEVRREMTTEEMIDYAFEGCYHEAGHAIVRAYLGMPLVSVTIECVKGVHAGFTDVVPRIITTYQDLVGATMFAAAGRVATDILAEIEVGVTRFAESDREDQEYIDAEAHKIGARLDVDPSQWKAGVIARTEAILRIPYVWAAAEELANQLLETGGFYAIPARQVRRILRKAKEEAESSG